MARYLGAVIGLLAGMTAGLACVVLGLLAFGAAPDRPPPASRDPVIRLDLTMVSPPEVNADQSVYQPIRDRLDRVGLLAVIADPKIDALARLASPPGSTIKSQAARGMAIIPRDGPRLDPPEPGRDTPFRSGEASMSPIMPYPGNVRGALLAARPELSVGLSAVSPSAGYIAPTGPEHFLQAGYFAHRENAVGLSEELAATGLSVLMEQSANRAGKTRWRVLVGPYRQKKDALRARHAAPNLLAEAFHTMQDN